MKCDICGSRRALIHIQQIAGNEEININICEKCAKDKGLTINNKELGVSLKNLLGNFDQIKKAIESRDNAKTCSECGNTIEQLKKTGKTGCPACYREFNKYISSFLKKTAGACEHRGKYPFRISILSRRIRQMDNLNLKLKDAVEGEKFEHAAYLRDRIKLMERQIKRYGKQ